MTKKKKLKTKIAVFSFIVLFLSSGLLPTQLNAAPLLNWENPNSKGFENPFKISWDTVITSGLLTQVVGCTGITNKLAKTILAGKELSRKFFQEITSDKAKSTVCRIVKGAAQTSLGGVPKVNNLPKGLDWFIDCGYTGNETYDPAAAKQGDNQQAKQEQSEFVKQCFNGIAFTLARNQLTAIARNTLNWVNAGFDGNPFFVQSVRSVLGSVERNVIEPAIYSLADKAFPYGEMFAHSYINRAMTGVPRSSSMLSHLVSNVADYVIVDYVDNPKLSSFENQKIREELAIEKFKDDFTEGGWNGWLSMTQIDANNPLGFYSAASNIISMTTEALTQDVREEMLQGSGYLSQKECVEWQVYDEKTKTPVIKETVDPKTGKKKLGYVFVKTKPTEEGLYGECSEHKTITPGANIKEQVNAVTQTPIKQLELADDINSILNSVFSVLLYAIQNQGLPGLTSGNYTYDTDNKGIGVSTFSNHAESSYSSSVLGGKGYQNDQFNLTRDLGNTFIYNWNSSSNLGGWNAHKNEIVNPKPGDCFDGYGNKISCPIKLQKKTAPTDCIGDDGQKIKCPANVFYTVTEPGKTELADGQYSGWAIGDRAFWDGEKWQNWKKDQANPIRNRGVLQLQKDYSVAAKELLSFLPGIMPKIGELDYCIPGPNPSWEIVANTHRVHLLEIASSINSDYSSSGALLSRVKEEAFYMPTEGDDVYDNYLNLFRNLDGNLTNFWNQYVIQTNKWNEIKSFSALQNTRRKESKDLIDSQADYVSSDAASEASAFVVRYKELIDKNFGSKSLLWKEFLTREDTSAMEKNPAYLEMISAGSKITEQIFGYNEEISVLREELEQEIIASDSSIYKLEKIKSEVSDIIIKAQERRAKKMIEMIREEENIPNFSLADFNKRYEKCLDEENINYYDDLVIMAGTENDADRCSDGIDNDGDGFIDMDDADCQFPLTTSGPISLDNFMDNDLGIGSSSEPGKYYGGAYNTRTTGESWEGEVKNEDKPYPLDSMKANAPICSVRNKNECARGIPKNTEELSYSFRWFCVSSLYTREIQDTDSIDHDYIKECTLLKEVNLANYQAAVDDLIQNLKHGKLDKGALKMMISYRTMGKNVTISSKIQTWLIAQLDTPWFEEIVEKAETTLAFWVGLIQIIRPVLQGTANEVEIALLIIPQVILYLLDFVGGLAVEPILEFFKSL